MTWVILPQDVVFHLKDFAMLRYYYSANEYSERCATYGQQFKLTL